MTLCHHSGPRGFEVQFSVQLLLSCLRTPPQKKATNNHHYLTLITYKEEYYFHFYWGGGSSGIGRLLLELELLGKGAPWSEPWLYRVPESLQKTVAMRALALHALGNFRVQGLGFGV